MSFYALTKMLCIYFIGILWLFTLKILVLLLKYDYKIDNQNSRAIISKRVCDYENQSCVWQWWLWGWPCIGSKVFSAGDPLLH